MSMKMASLAKLEANASGIARLICLLANKERVRILYRLAKSQGELSVTELAEGIAISRSALSQHLTKLRRGGAISVRRVGHNCLYRITDPRSAQLAIELVRF
jgi:DNA-binding transcriptional ArsR family regulator